MNKRLHQIADIRAGFTVRKEPSSVETKTIPVLQIKNVRSDGTIDVSNLSTVGVVESPRSHFLEAGDVLFCARGERNAAAVYTGEVPDAIAGSQLFVLRVQDSQVDPRYLAWYFNQPSTRRFFSQHQAGSHIRIVYRRTLEDMEVALPPLAVQQRIVEMDRLIQKEQSLLKHLAEKRKALSEVVCMKMATHSLITESNHE